MVTFKQFLKEELITANASFGTGKFPVIVNPSNGQEIFSNIDPDTRESRIGGGDTGDPIYKFAYNINTDKLYVWWVGDGVHDDIINKFNLGNSSGNPEVVFPIQETNTDLIGYIDLKKRILEFSFMHRVKTKDIETIIKGSNKGKLLNFSKRFKTHGATFSKSKFSKFF